ncbi:MAG TPA: hypothetical protein VMV56_12620 [Williamwhitmania sp.]|nr:hypothetical protein [Williamwhitmania sp.]
MKKIPLSANHRRSVSSSLLLVEKYVNEIEQKLSNPSKLTMYQIANNVDEQRISNCMLIAKEIKVYIGESAKKYSLTPSEVDIQRVISSKKAAMWEILCDTNSSRLKGFGLFPVEIADEFDSDIERLQKMVEEI